MSRPTSEPAAVLVGHGVGATPPHALAGATARHAWLDTTMSLTLLAPPGAAFDDEAAVRAWAGRAWQDLSSPGDEAVAPEPVAWRAGRRGSAVVGVTWPAAELLALPAALRSVAPLWAGVLARALASLRAEKAWRLVIAEGRSLTLIDVEQALPVRWARLALRRDDAALLEQALPKASGPVWVAGHSLQGELPAGVQMVPGLGTPTQAPSALLAALSGTERAEPALRRPPLLSRRVGALLLATALLVLGLASHTAWVAHEAWRNAQARAESRDRLAEQHGRERQRQQAQWAAVRQRLDQPWALRWAAAEAAQPADGGWLRLEQRRDSTSLLLVGEAGAPAEALAVARRIAALPGVQDAQLLRSEVAGREGRARFELAVVLAESQP